MRAIYVEGDIIFKSGYSWVKTIGAYYDEKIEELADEIISGDLIVTKENPTKSYIEYYAKGTVKCYGIDDGNCRFLNHPHYVFKEYRNNIALVKEFAEVGLPDNLEEMRYNQLYISVIGSLELFLSEIMVNMVLGYEKYFNSFLENYNKPIALNQVIKLNKEPEQFIYNLIKDINCHQIKGIRRFFEDVFGEQLPEQAQLVKKIMLRHDLVHRFGKPKEGGENSIKEADFRELVVLCDILVADIEGYFMEDLEGWSVVKEKLLI